MFKTICILISAMTISCFASDLSHLDEIEKGQQINGPKMSAKDLKGKVILFEYWAFN